MKNQRSLNLPISKAIDGFVKFKTAEGLSKHTIDVYQYNLTNWLNRIGDVDVSQITAAHITNHLAYMRTEFVPRRFNGSTAPLSPKTIRNIYVTLRSFFAWLHNEFQIPNPSTLVPSPRFGKPEIQTLTKEEIESLLKACVYTREYHPLNRTNFVTRRPTASRDQAIILMLLDTGLRATELCHLTVADVDLTTGKVIVKHGAQGGAKGGKGRSVYLGKVTRKAVWFYLAKRDDSQDLDLPLFISHGCHPFTKDSLRQLVKRIASRAEVKNVYPHKFRHTFAISYLRAGGDVFTLQSLLGHSSLDMVRHYARIAEVDVAEAHRRASPADRWKL